MMKGGHKRGRNGLGEGHRGKMIAGVSICRGGLLENTGCFQAARDAGMRGISGTGYIFNIITTIWLNIRDPVMLWLWCMLVGPKWSCCLGSMSLPIPSHLHHLLGKQPVLLFSPGDFHGMEGSIFRMIQKEKYALTREVNGVLKTLCSSSSGTSVKQTIPTDGTNVTSCMNYEARAFLVGTKGFFYSTPFQINCICPLPSVVLRTFEQKSYSSSRDL